MSMKESSTYQAILEEGEAKGLWPKQKKCSGFRVTTLSVPPDARTAAAIERLNDLTRLEDLLHRVHSVTSWLELLGPLVGGSRKG
jgi:hypothetical protein